MYAIKLELKLNNKQRTLMARHSGYARFCYNYALSLYQEVKSLPGSSSKKVTAIERVFTNHVKKMPEYQWTNTLSSRVYKMTFRHFSPHSADVGRIFLSVVKTWKRNAFGRKLSSFSITEACQIYLN